MEREMDKIAPEPAFDIKKIKFDDEILRPKCELLMKEEEALRKTTVLRQRKVSTQLKLETMHRHVSSRRRPFSVHESSDIKFFKDQMMELSDELQCIGLTLARAEREAYCARKRLQHRSGMDTSSDDETGQVSPLSTSQPIRPHDVIDGGISRSLRSKALNLFLASSLRRRILSGELRPVASLSSLPSSPSYIQSEEILGPSQKDRKSPRGPLKAIGQFMDSHILSRFVGTARRTRSADAVLKDDVLTIQSVRPHTSTTKFVPVNGGRTVPHQNVSSSISADDDSEVNGDDGQSLNKQQEQSKTTEVDPKLLAEIEEFENMAAKYIREHKEDLHRS